MQNRITDLETQRDIYKSMYEDWKGAAGEVAGYADTLRDSLKARDRLDGKLLVEDAGDFLCTAYCTEKRSTSAELERELPPAVRRWELV